jgi:endonuclease/exonuclease/phosphatase family metal-dependent hydrolase
MKLISLNIWGGQIFAPLLEFIEKHSLDTDIFCFQEVFSTSADKQWVGAARVDIYQQIKNVLPDFQDFSAPAQENIVFDGPVDFPVSFGLAMFVKKTITVETHGDVFVFRNKNARENHHKEIGKNVEFITFTNEQNKFAIFNLHGLWNGAGKTDTEDRLEQSRKTKEFLEKFPDHKIILCGDFNLLPETESLKILENGLTNLIKEYNITSTRSRFYDKPNFSKFADYALVSKNLEIKNFAVLADEVSDHLALMIEFN